MCITWGEFFTQLGIGTLGSLIAVILVSTCAYFSFWKPNKAIKELGFVKKWDNQKDAEKDILNDIKKSSKLDIFTTRGDSFTNVDNKNGIAKYIFEDIYIDKRILISSPGNLFLAIRQQELETANKQPVNNLKEEVANSYNKLKIECNKPNKQAKFKVKQHTENPVRYRLIMLSDCMYVSQQLSTKCSQESPIIKYTKDSFWYDILSAEFEGFWGKY
jgi:hypothetical protein